MKILKPLAFALTLFISMNAFSQNVPLSLDELIPGGEAHARLYQKRNPFPHQLKWYGDKLTYVKGETIYEVDPKAKKDKPLISLKEINDKIGVDAVSNIQSVGSMYGELSSILVRTKGKESYLLNLATSNVDATYKLGSGISNIDYCVNNKMMAYTKENNLYLQNKDGDEIVVAEDENKGIVFGSSVHQNEFGIRKGTYWSPDGTYLAFYRMDETMVTEYPLVDISARTTKQTPRKYPMAGMKSHHVTVGIYNIKEGSTVYLKTGTPKEKYLTNLAWSPNEKQLYIAEINRGQDTLVMKSYSIETGKLNKTLFTETHDKYIDPQQPPLFVKNDASRFVWQSSRDGYNHAYLYNTDGTLEKQLTSGEWDITDVLGFDEKGENLVYISGEESPIEKHVYRVELKNAKRHKLTKEVGTHSARLSTSGKYLYDYYTSQHNPGKLAITEVKKGKPNVFHQAKNPYEGTTLPEITLGTLKADDGVADLHYRLIKPLNFDKNKKYPVIVYVYGGPHSQLVDNSWLGQAGGWHLYMAELGYVVFTLDNRGTRNRGAAFENITHRQLGVVETRDQMTGVDFLKSQPYVDADRIGVHGWSYGGFMTMNLMLRHPATFKVGVAGGPVTDWKYYEIMYGERYMDSPQENPEGYKNSSMVERAGDLQGRLLIIHGDIDPVVVPQHSLQFLKSAIKKGTHPDFFVYPGHEHNMMGKDRVHLHEHITRYFKDFLK